MTGIDELTDYLISHVKYLSIYPIKELKSYLCQRHTLF